MIKVVNVIPFLGVDGVENMVVNILLIRTNTRRL